MTKKLTTVTVPVLRGKVLGVNVYRGFARLCDLALVSQADIYDPKTNPTGTQRDLSPKHAKDAYDYVTSKQVGFWPEVFLCTRDSSVLSFSPVAGTGGDGFGTLQIDISKLEKLRPKIAISRVDGNHRLHYADGLTEGYPPIEKLSSFCLAMGLSLDAEISLFRDINNNQRRMSTSHLDNVEVRLSGDELLKRQSPHLYIAKKLAEDGESPFKDRV
jgi:DGQHR domain-containing protein